MNGLKNSLAKILKTRKHLNQKGFTLLELLVVVAILAAVAGTASIALKDTDARASAAAHVAMMDELNKGIGTYRVLQKNELPSRFDSLMVSAAPTVAGAAAATPLSALGFDGTADAATVAIPDAVQKKMADGGITELRYIDETATPWETAVTGEDCTNANIQALIGSRKNAVVAGNIFLSDAANGCGYSVTIKDDGTAADPKGLFWNAGQERLTGQPEDAAVVVFDGTNLATATSNAYLLTGIGPSSTLFDANRLGGMTTVPVYRHVKPNEYNRFIAVWNVGTFNGAGGITAPDQVDLIAILDGALDTKEEELGEWDGTRNTI